MLKSLDPQSGGSPPVYRVILDALEDDEWLPNVQHWRESALEPRPRPRRLTVGP